MIDTKTVYAKNQTTQVNAQASLKLKQVKNMSDFKSLASLAANRFKCRHAKLKQVPKYPQKWKLVLTDQQPETGL